MNKKQFNAYISDKPHIIDYFNALGFKKNRHYGAYAVARNQTSLTDEAQEKQAPSKTKKKAMRVNQSLALMWAAITLVNTTAAVSSKAETGVINIALIGMNLLCLGVFAAISSSYKKEFKSAAASHDNYIERETWDMIGRKARNYKAAIAKDRSAMPQPLINS